MVDNDTIPIPVHDDDDDIVVSEDDDLNVHDDDIPDEDLNCTGTIDDDDHGKDDDHEKEDIDDDDENTLHIEYEFEKKNTQWRAPLKGSTYPYMESDLVSDPDTDHDE